MLCSVQAISGVAGQGLTSKQQFSSIQSVPSCAEALILAQVASGRSKQAPPARQRARAATQGSLLARRLGLQVQVHWLQHIRELHGAFLSRRCGDVVSPLPSPP